jgi:hypothetical protein
MYQSIVRSLKKPYPEFSVNLLRTGYFMLYKHQVGIFGDLIVKHQKEMGFPDELATFTHVDVLGPREWAIRIMPPKAKVVNIRTTYKGVQAVMLEYDAQDFESKRDKVAWWAVSNNNKFYDLWGVAKFKLPFLFHKKDLPFCSENAVEALRMEYPDDLRLEEPYKIPPAGIFKFCKVKWFGTIS